MELVWEKRSHILWVAEANGRRFRITKGGTASHGSVMVSEVDELQRPKRQRAVRGQAEGKRVAQRWAERPEWWVGDDEDDDAVSAGSRAGK